MDSKRGDLEKEMKDSGRSGSPAFPHYFSFMYSGRLWDKRSEVRIQVGTRDFHFIQNVHIGSGNCPAFYLMPAGVLTRGKAAQAWYWPLTSIYSRGWEWVELHLYASCMRSCNWEGQLHRLYFSMQFGYIIVIPKYKVVQIWPGLFVCKKVTVCPGHIWTTLYTTTILTLLLVAMKAGITSRQDSRLRKAGKNTAWQNSLI